jgi:inorganic pyrophosphatase/exopolyphosphatase
MIGAKKLIEDRGDEIIAVLQKLKSDMGLDYIFQNTIELEDQMNFFVTDDMTTKELLEKVLGVRFDGIVAERKELIMRKQIVPLLKEELEQ